MKTQILILITLILFVIIIFTRADFAQEAGKLYEKALFQEESDGNLQKAITLYEKIVKEYGNETEIAAKAQLHIGFCYEKLGKSEAIKAYELVVEKYSNQKEQVATAQSRLNELKKEPPKGLTVVNLGGWDKPGMTLQSYEIFPDKKLGVGVEFMKGQNIITYNLETDEVKFITEHTWDRDGFTWTYHPSLSPDGKEIVYFSQFVTKKENYNSLIIKTIDGQSYTVASDTNIWYIPNAWTPDGKGILTIKGSSDSSPQLGIISKDGSEFKVLATLQEKDQQLGKTYPTASISPDGQYVLFTDNAQGEKSDIYIVGVDGKDPEVLFKNPAEDNYPRWSPDGKNFIFLSLRHGSRALWGADFQNGKVKGEPYLIRDGMKDSYLLNWSNEGLASWEWVRISDIYQVDIDPMTYKPIGKPIQIDYVPTGYNGAPVWSHDGKHFAFVRSNPSSGTITIVVIGKDRKEYHVPDEYNYNYLRWSPDDNLLGMVAKDKKGVWNFYRLQLKTSEWEVTPIPVEGFAMFEWCGDGKSILLSKGGTRELGAGIYELNLETSKEEYKYHPTDTTLVMFMMLRCSGDYKRVTFLENNKDVMVVDLETGETTLAGENLGFPWSWLPDGQKILTDGYFASDESHQSIFAVQADGDSVTEINLSQYLPKESRVIFPDWSPDGKVVFALNSRKSETLLFKNIIASVKEK